MNRCPWNTAWINRRTPLKRQAWLQACLGHDKGNGAWQRHGDSNRFADRLQAFPPSKGTTPPSITPQGAIWLHGAPDQDPSLKPALQTLMPWKKGPWRWGDLAMDSEWRGEIKWERLAPFLPDLSGALVLDIGCGNGYHAYRAHLAGAELVIGAERSLLYAMQAYAASLYDGDSPVIIWPSLGEEIKPVLPEGDFDLILSMGVYYHHRDPLAHLQAIYQLLKPGGMLVLEGLVLPLPLYPPGRYANMNNIRLIPSPSQVLQWLQACGFCSSRLCHQGPTTLQEQRASEWILSPSLADFLDPHDPYRTIEGHPAPVRGLWTALKPQ